MAKPNFKFVYVVRGRETDYFIREISKKKSPLSRSAKCIRSARLYIMIVLLCNRWAHGVVRIRRWYIYISSPYTIFSVLKMEPWPMEVRCAGFVTQNVDDLYL